MPLIAHVRQDAALCKTHGQWPNLTGKASNLNKVGKESLPDAKILRADLVVKMEIGEVHS